MTTLISLILIVSIVYYVYYKLKTSDMSLEDRKSAEKVFDDSKNSRDF